MTPDSTPEAKRFQARRFVTPQGDLWAVIDTWTSEFMRNDVGSTVYNNETKSKTDADAYNRQSEFIFNEEE